MPGPNPKAEIPPPPMRPERSSPDKFDLRLIAASLPLPHMEIRETMDRKELTEEQPR